MRLSSLLLRASALCATARVLPDDVVSFNVSIPLRDSTQVYTNHTGASSANIVWKSDTEDEAQLTPAKRWCKYVGRGTQLMKAMMMPEEEASRQLGWPYVQSPFDGDMKQDLATWGYLDTDELHQSRDAACNFKETHKLGNVFTELDTDPRSAGEGGPNHCFYVQHSDSPAMLRDQNNEIPRNARDQRYRVGPTEYKATDAHAGIGVNPNDGWLYMLDRSSAAEAARWLWGRTPASNELPKLRSTSDIAFGFWNRIASAANRRNLKYIMSCNILNEHTEETMKAALKKLDAGALERQVWPGTDFEFAFGVNKGEEIEAALALLGSPNGIAAGYFLIQHKEQLGWKYTWKVKVFVTEDEFPDIYMMFYVSDQAPWGDSVSDVGAQLQKSHSKSRRKRSQECTTSGRSETSRFKKVKEAYGRTTL